MFKININFIKKLRKISGAGLIDCKKALIKSNNNITNAIIEMRKNGIIKLLKKKNDITINGIISTIKKKNYGIIIEINCQTDFASKSDVFIKFSDNIIKNMLYNKVKKTENLNLLYKKKIVDTFNKIRENIYIKRFHILKKNIIEIYNHNNKIGVLLKAKFIKKDILKKIAMHIVSNKPEFINVENIPYNLIINEYKIQNIIINKKKYIKKIILGKIKKYINEITLINQKFIFDININVKKMLNNNNSIILKFVRYELGEIF